MPLDQWEEPRDRVIGRASIVHGERRHEREGRTLDELLFARAPRGGLRVGEGRPVEQAAARDVDDVPRVEPFRPVLHLLLGDRGGVLHHGGEESRLVDPGAPQLPGEAMVGPDALCQGAKARHGDPECPVRPDAEPGHALPARRIGEPMQLLEHLLIPHEPPTSGLLATDPRA